MLTSTKSAAALLVLAVTLAGCNTTPTTAEARQTLHDQVAATVNNFKQSDPGIQRFFNNAYAYAVFPAIGEGAVGVGGAYGHGEVFQNGKFIGHCNMTQGSVGVQVGGQSFSEIIFFKDKGELDAFTSGQFTFDAQASAVALAAGASASADYKKGVLVFTQARGGLMVQAAIGGQKFAFTPDVETASDNP